MGRDKGLVVINGARMIEHVIAALRPHVSSIIIVANSDAYRQFGYPVIKDIIHECGPMGGIYSGLLHSETMKNVVVSCDIPFISPALIAALTGAPGDADVVLFSHSGKYEPLCARYRKTCALKMVNPIEAGNLKMNEFLATVETKIIRSEDIPGFEARQLANINTPTELNQYSVQKI